MRLGLDNCLIRSHLYYAVIVFYNTMPSIIREIKITGAPITSRKTFKKTDSHYRRNLWQDTEQLQYVFLTGCEMLLLILLIDIHFGWISLGVAIEGEDSYVWLA